MVNVTPPGGNPPRLVTVNRKPPTGNPPKLVAVVGPTATGKTTTAIALAREFGGEIVNADSRLVYRGMDIGTAKPSSQQLAAVSHHLVDLVEPHQAFNLSQYLVAARSTISQMHADGAKLPILVGGSGQYVWALLEGWNVPTIPIDYSLRAELEQMLDNLGLEQMQDRLLRLDPDAATKVDMPNPRRVLRGIERAIATGDAMGGASKSDSPPYDACVIGLTASRSVLRERVAIRIDEMLDAGWLNEVRGLMSDGIDANSPGMYSIGYREMLRHINGEINLDAAKQLVVRATIRLVDAQENWFKKSDDRITWFDVTEAGHAARVLEFAKAWHRGS